MSGDLILMIDGSQPSDLNRTIGCVWGMTRNALWAVLPSWNATRSIVWLSKVGDMALGTNPWINQKATQSFGYQNMHVSSVSHAAMTATFTFA